MKIGISRALHADLSCMHAYNNTIRIAIGHHNTINL